MVAVVELPSEAEVIETTVAASVDSAVVVLEVEAVEVVAASVGLVVVDLVVAAPVALGKKYFRF